MSKISSKHELEKKYLVDLDKPLFLLIQHPVTTEFEKSDLQIKMTLGVLSKLKNQTIAILPNSDAGNEQIINQLRIFSKKCSFLKVFPNLPRNDYLGFLKHCSALIGNSSSGLIEGSYLHTPVVNIGIRLNPNTNPKTLSQISTGKKQDKFGVPEKNFLELVRYVKNSKFINL